MGQGYYMAHLDVDNQHIGWLGRDRKYSGGGIDWSWDACCEHGILPFT
jgi:hypothetical protein